ncbi:hypothetical protein Tco_0682890 [Tanacetum coccineum]|uniref:Uncharacterized protein n=1 Tax=Tanacetum coccineum TaxID=301880 RepID=A0ABQ4XSH4_9ASTR
MAAPGSSNVLERRDIDEIVEFGGKTEVPKYMKVFILQEIFEAGRLATVLRDEARTVRTCLAHVNAMIAEMEAKDDQMEVYDSLMCLRDSRRIANDKLLGLNDMIAEAEEEISTYEGHVEIMDAASMFEDQSLVLEVGISSYGSVWLLVADKEVQEVLMILSLIIYCLQLCLLLGIMYTRLNFVCYIVSSVSTLVSSWVESYIDAKSLWEAIKSRFEGNEESQKMQKNVLKHQFENFTTAPNESLDKAYDRVYEDEMKRSLSSTSNSHNLAFLSSENTSRTNEVSSTPGADEVVCSFFAQQTTSPPLDNEDLQQIDQDDSEELDIRWQVAMLTVRVQRFIKKTGRNLDFTGKQPVTFDKSQVECYNYSEHSTVTYTSVSFLVEDDSDIGSPGVDGPPIMPEDPYAYIMAAYEVPPSPDYEKLPP